MMQVGARQIWSHAKKESNVKDPDLGYGWWIDLKVRNKVERVEDDDEEDMKVPAKQKAKAKKRSKMKVPKK